MTFSNESTQQNFVPNDLILPDSYSQAVPVLTDYIRRVVEALNDKEVAIYNTSEQLNGQQWFTEDNPQEFRQAFRQVINFGSLPNGTVKTAVHNIDTSADTIFTRIYATATNPGASSVTRAIPIPYVDPSSITNSIEIYVDDQFVNIVTAADYTAYTECVVVLEYLQQD